MDHVVVRTAHRTARREKPAMPKEASYDAIAGVWTIAGNTLVRAQNFGPVTKKADQETGEDQKGE